MRRILQRVLEKLLPWLLKASFSSTNPLVEFNAWEVIRLNQRRLEHLAGLGLDLSGRSVLEVGAGIGNLTHFFLDRGCRVLTTEARPDNLKVLQARYPGLDVQALDLDQPTLVFPARFDVVFCYGLLYHLQQPAEAIAYLARQCGGLFLLETCLSFGEEELVNPCAEDHCQVSQAVSGIGCRPTRPWVLAQLKQHFEFVYVPATQPNHEQFPVDWDAAAEHKAPYVRAVFIASRTPLRNPVLLQELPRRQSRH